MLTAVPAPEPLVFVDLETSGANFANDRIIEIGLLIVDGDGAREWSTLVNPETPVSPFITGLTGIDDAMVAGAPTFRQLASTVLEMLRGRLFIAHNARFDYGFLQSEFKRLGLTFRMPTLCTVKLSRKLFPEHHRHNLDTLIQRHSLTVAGTRHRALADARLLWDLWRCWHGQLPAATIRSAVALIVGRPDLPPQLDAALIDDLPEAPGAYAFYGEDGRLLLCRRSGNIRQQVLAHFTAAHRENPLHRDTWRIAWRDAAGELGARLAEVELARTACLPAENSFVAPLVSAGPQRSPASDGLCSWQLQQDGPGDFRPQLVFADEVDFSLASDLFGLYPNRREALRTLRRLADAHRLCCQHLGLEPAVRGEACTAYRQKNCRGVCVGKEAPALHGARLLTALARYKVKAWPYRGPIALLERDEFGMREDLHLIDRWRHVATVHSEQALLEQLDRLDGEPCRSPFDPDTYRIISKFLQAGKVRVRPLPCSLTA